MYDFENAPIWEMVSSKSVHDTDGWVDDYSLWHDIENDRWCCIFGDNDLYDPYNAEPDAEFDSEDEAIEWFDNYYGPGDDDPNDWEDEL